MIYFKFLLLKTRKNLLHIIPLLITTLFIIFVYVFHNYASAFSSLEFTQSQYRQNIEYTLDDPLFQKEQAYFKQNLANIKNQNWQNYYKNEIQLSQIRLNQLRYNTSNQEDKKREQLNINYASHMRKYSLGYDDRFAYSQGISFTIDILNNHSYIILIILLVYIFSNTICSFYSDDMDIHQLLPINQKNKHISIILLGSFIGIMIIFFMTTVSILCGSFGNTLGNLNSPILIFDPNSLVLEGADQYIPFLSIMVSLIILILLDIIFIVNVVSLVSTLIHKNMTCIMISLIIIAGLVIICTHIIPLHPITHLLPGAYLNPLPVLTLKTSWITHNNQVNFVSGFFVLTIYNIILYSAYYFIKKKKEHHHDHLCQISNKKII